MTRKGVKLIAPDKNGILCYQGDCKVIIDPIFKVLKIHPKSEEFFDVCAFFRWKFIQKKNLLFIFGEYNFQDFVLVFKNEELCKRVHDIIYKHKDEEEGFIQEEQLRQRLLIPIFQKLPQNYSTRFKRIIIDWIEQHEDEEKQELMNLLKPQRRNQMMDIKNVKQEPNPRNVRKRRFSEIEINSKNTASNEDNNNDSRNCNRSNNIKCENEDIHSKKNKLKYPDVIDKSKFKIVYVKHKDRIRRKLLVFTSYKKTNCYEYNYHPTKEFFYHRCRTNPNGMKAILALNENGNECIKYEKKKHRCSPIEYDPKKYEEIKIIKKSDYNILENCSTKSKRRMVIFDPNNRNQCYEYYWETTRKRFYCCGCIIQKKCIFAEVFHENTDAEYILILKNQHFCKTRKYDPEKYPESKKYVLSPNFEIQTKINDEIKRKTLIIFYGNDRQMCYTYFFHTNKKLFFCNGCIRKGKNVFARIYQNDDGEDYVILSNVQHVCSPKEYIPQQNVVIIRPPKVKFIESTEAFHSKLFIFDSNDNKFCYIFSKCHGENTKKYYCLGCHKLTKSMKEACIVFLCKASDDSNGEYYVKMMDGQKHVCKPQKYEPEKYETKILKSKNEYILFQKKRNAKDFISLSIYDSNDKNFCYIFYYDKSNKYFQCCECQKKKTSITAKIHQDPNGNECIIMNQKKHVCSPIKVSSVIKPNTVILEKSGLSVERRKEKEIDESRIIRSPNFELQKNTKGVPERKLIIFYGDDNSLCYEYRYNNKFVCMKCRVSAKLHYDLEKNYEKYIVLGPNEHSCDPVKYVAEKTKTINSSEFMIFNQDNDSKLTKLVVFTSAAKKECYEYSFIKCEKSFRCSGCFVLKAIITAKLVNDSNDEEYIQLLKNDHICEPKKFVLEEFQPKIITENGF